MDYTSSKFLYHIRLLRVNSNRDHFGLYFMSLKLMDIKVSQVTSNKYIKYNNNKNKTYTRIN